MTEWKIRRSKEFKDLKEMNGQKYMTEEIGMKISGPEGRLEDAFRVKNENMKEVFYGTLENCQNWISKKIK